MAATLNKLPFQYVYFSLGYFVFTSLPGRKMSLFSSIITTIILSYVIIRIYIVLHIYMQVSETEVLAELHWVIGESILEKINSIYHITFVITFWVDLVLNILIVKWNLTLLSPFSFDFHHWPGESARIFTTNIFFPLQKIIKYWKSLKATLQLFSWNDIKRPNFPFLHYNFFLRQTIKVKTTSYSNYLSEEVLHYKLLWGFMR